MSTHVHRNGAHGITVQDEAGRELALVSDNYRLHVLATQLAGPSLTPQTARDLADELNQWADCQQTIRSHHRRSRDSSAADEEAGEPARI